jgi:hypothetical protein
VHPPGSQSVEQTGGHLAAPRVLHADEQDLGDLLGQLSLHLSQRPQALAGEAVDEQRHEVLESRGRQGLQRLGHVALDRLPGEDAIELRLERFEALLQMTPGGRVDL